MQYWIPTTEYKLKENLQDLNQGQTLRFWFFTIFINGFNSAVSEMIGEVVSVFTEKIKCTRPQDLVQYQLKIFLEKPFARWRRQHQISFLFVFLWTLNFRHRLCLSCVVWDYSNSKQKAKQYREHLNAKLQNSNQHILGWRSRALRWLITVSSSFQEVDFDGSLLPLLITWCDNHDIEVMPNHRWTRWYHFRDTVGYHSNTMTC